MMQVLRMLSNSRLLASLSRRFSWTHIQKVTPIQSLRHKTMNTFQERSRIFKALKKGGPSFGAWQMLPGTNHSRAIARSGVDWICIDGEHGNIADPQMHESITAIAATGVSPLVRIPANEAWMVKRALDAGAHGIVVPLIYTVEDAQRLVASAKFPPEGQRGFGSPFSTQAFSNENGTYYLQNANASILTLVQIETASALKAVREIAEVPGVDVLLIGPYDLGNNIGHPIVGPEMDEEVVQAIKMIKYAAHAAGKKVAMYCNNGEQAKEYVDQGYDMISISNDVHGIQNYYSQQLAAAIGKGKEETQKKEDEDGLSRGVSGYMFFVNDQRDNILRENPSIQFGGVGKLLTEKWEGLSAEQRAPYDEQAAAANEKDQR